MSDDKIVDSRQAGASKPDPEGLKKHYFNRGLTPFERDERMNTLFGNHKGNKHDIQWQKVAMKLKVLASEMVETCRAAGLQVSLSFGDTLGQPDLEKFLDGLGDVNTVLNGVAHFAGVDLDEIHWAVLTSNLSKFCKDTEELRATISKYQAIGVEVEPGGQFPFAYVKSAKDQMIGDDPCPAGKFLKGVGFKEPDFTKIMAPEEGVLDVLHSLECIRMDRDAMAEVRERVMRSVSLPGWLFSMQQDGILPK